MIRSTVNATIKTIHESGIKHSTKEICEGSIDGTAPSALHELSGDEWLANKATNAGATITPVPSDAHWNGLVIT